MLDCGHTRLLRPGVPPTFAWWELVQARNRPSVWVMSSLWPALCRHSRPMGSQAVKAICWRPQRTLLQCLRYPCKGFYLLIRFHHFLWVLHSYRVLQKFMLNHKSSLPKIQCLHMPNFVNGVLWCNNFLFADRPEYQFLWLFVSIVYCIFCCLQSSASGIYIMKNARNLIKHINW